MGGAWPSCGHLMRAGSSREGQSWVLLPCRTVQGGEAGVKWLGWLFLREQFKKRGKKKKRLIWQREKMGKRCLTVLASLHMRKLLCGSASCIESFRAPPLIADD